MHSSVWLRRAFLLLPFFLPAYVLRMPLGPIPTTALELAIGVLVLSWLFVRRMEGLRHAWKRITPWRIPVALWLAAGIVGVGAAAMNGFDVLAALGLFRAYFVEPLLIFAIGLDLLRTDADRTDLFLSLTLVVILLTAYAVVQYATGWGIPHPWSAWPGRRATGPFPFPNALALFVVPFGALAAARFLRERNRFVPAVLFGCAVLAAVLAQSDGGLIALGVALIATLLFHAKTRLPTLAVLAVLILATLAVDPAREQATEKLLFQEWSGKVRTVMWEETVQMLQAYPIFGAGLAAYPQAILPYHTATWMEVFQYPHNSVLNLWTETGIVGLIAFTVLLVVWIRRGPRDIVIPVILALLVHGLVDVPYFKNDLAVAFWLLVLLTTPRDSKTA